MSLSDVLAFVPMLYFFKPLLWVPGVALLVASLWLGRGMPAVPRLWFLVPMGLAHVGAALGESFARAAGGGHAEPVAALVFYGVVELLAIGFAVAMNRRAIIPALLLAGFAATYAGAGFTAMRLAGMCAEGC